MLKIFREKAFKQRGVAIVEYAMLLAFVAILGAVFLSMKGGTSAPLGKILTAIDSIIKNIIALLTV